MDALERLRGLGLELAVVANWDLSLRRLLDEIDLTRYFRAVVHAAGKPAPDGLLRAPGQIGVDTTRAVLAPFQQESWAIGLPKGSPLREKVNAFLVEYRKSGGFDRLGDKWLAEQKAEFKKLGIPFLF